MFEQLARRAERIARERGAARRLQLAAMLAEQTPAGVEVSAEDERVVLSGRGLGRRFALEAALRWLVAETKDER